jgi:hypothetical protein
MSGGAFQYKQYELGHIADQIEDKIINNDSTEEDDYGWEKGEHYKPEVISRLKDAVTALRVAQVYAQRADWLFSCDDGEDSFLRRLASDLKEVGQ